MEDPRRQRMNEWLRITQEAHDLCVDDVQRQITLTLGRSIGQDTRALQGRTRVSQQLPEVDENMRGFSIGRFHTLFNMVESTQDPLERMLLTSPGVVAAVMAVSEGVRVYPEEADVLHKALQKSGDVSSYYFLLSQNPQVREEHLALFDDEGIVEQMLQEEGSLDSFVQNAQFERESPDILFVYRMQAGEMGANLRVISPQDLSLQRGEHVTFARLESEMQAISGDFFGDYAREETTERNQYYLKEYLGAYTNNKLGEHVVKSLIALERDIHLLRYLLSRREAFKKRDFVDTLVRRVGYEWK